MMYVPRWLLRIVMILAFVVVVLIMAISGEAADADGWDSGIRPHRPVYAAMDGNKDIKWQVSGTADIFALGELRQGLPSIAMAYTGRGAWEYGFDSSPFREMNHELEAFLEFGSHPYALRTGAWHHSNGEDRGKSRSWDRVFIQRGFLIETPSPAYTIYSELTIWYVYAAELSHNPQIEKYGGIGQALIEIDASWIRLRGTVRIAPQLHTAIGQYQAELSVRLPWDDVMRTEVYAQYFEGYFEEIIPYDVKTASLYVGFRVREWRWE